MDNNNSLHDEENFSDDLLNPKVQWWVDSPRVWFKGFWFKPEFVTATMAIEKHFTPLPTDILLASYPKTGTTWLKALTLSILGQYSSTLSTSEANKQVAVDLLSNKNPHELVPFLEIETFGENPSRGINSLSEYSPRIFNTHLPYSILPDQIKNSGCRIVYISRNPADTFMSLWHVYNKQFGTTISLEEAFDEFCQGFVPAGPYFNHVLEFWKVREKKNVFFVTYEELKMDPGNHVRRLAEFLGCLLRFDQIEQVVQDCSFERLSRLDVNNDKKKVHWSGLNFGTFFRRGTVGDWKNHLTPDMVAKLHMVANQAWEASIDLKLKMFNQLCSESES